MRLASLLKYFVDNVNTFLVSNGYVSLSLSASWENVLLKTYFIMIFFVCVPDPSVIPPCSAGDCQMIAAGLKLGLCPRGRSAPAALGPLKAGTQAEVWSRAGNGLLFGCVIQHRAISAWCMCRNGKDLLKSGESLVAVQPRGEWTVPGEPWTLNQNTTCCHRTVSSALAPTDVECVSKVLC